MPLPLFVAMKCSVAAKFVARQRVHPEGLDLPRWCHYVPFKDSRQKALEAFKEVTYFDDFDISADDGKVHCVCLKLTLNDEQVTEYFTSGNLTKDEKHQGYRYWGALPLDGSISFEWIDVTLA